LSGENAKVGFNSILSEVKPWDFTRSMHTNLHRKNLNAKNILNQTGEKYNSITE
jgi:hypothetical protein